MGFLFPEPNPGMFHLQALHFNHYNKTPPHYWLSFKTECVFSAYALCMNSPFSHCHQDKSTWRAIVDSRSLQTVYRVHYNVIIILTMLIVMLAAG